MSDTRLRWPALAAYGSLRAPLALLELPLYVLLPAFYAETAGVELALIGAILFGTRLLDALIDPTLGSMLDRSGAGLDLRRWTLLALPLLLAGFIAIFNPPSWVAPAWWLLVTSMLVYLAYSLISIAYQTWGAQLGSSADERIRVTATREGFGLAGVLLSASFLNTDSTQLLIGLFAVASVASGFALRYAPGPKPRPSPQTDRPPRPRLLSAWRQVLGLRAFRWLLAVFVINGIATAIPATLVLFFIADVLDAEQQAPMFLFVYFLAGAIGMPLWVRLSRRLGLTFTWLTGMSVAVAAFVWTLGLGTGDVVPFTLVCVLTGFALGADLAVPSAMLANLLARRAPVPANQIAATAIVTATTEVAAAARVEASSGDATFFGVWNLATKLNLAMAAGICLPLVGWLGYVPGQRGVDTIGLSMVYAALPCLLKLFAGCLLLLAPLPIDERSAGRPDFNPTPQPPPRSPVQ